MVNLLMRATYFWHKKLITYLHKTWNDNTHTKFDENPLTFTQIIVWKRKYGRTYDRRIDGQVDTQTANVHHENTI